MTPDTSESGKDLDRLFHALADTNRRAMLSALSHGPASMKELAAPLGLALPSALKHLQVLEAGGMVSSEKSGRVRTFAMQNQGLAKVEAWLDEHQRQLGLGFDRLADLLAEIPEEPKA